MDIPCRRCSLRPCTSSVHAMPCFDVPCPPVVVAAQDGLPRGSAELIVRPLYAALPYDEQLKALEPAQIMKDGRPMRKCIVSTNIAETSVTIPGIVYVVDAGFVKVGNLAFHRLQAVVCGSL